MNKLIVLIKTHLRFYVRNKSVMIGAVAFPLIFIGVFGIAFQYSDPGTETINIGIIDNDTGITPNAFIYNFEGDTITEKQLSQSFKDLLLEITFEDNATYIFKLSQYSISQEEEAIDDLNKREIMGLLYIPEDFSISYMAAYQDYFANDIAMRSATGNWSNYPVTGYSTELRLIGDRSLQSFAIASSVLDTVVDAFFSIRYDPFSKTNLRIEGTVDTKGFTAFDYILPGLVIFAIMNTIGIIATVALRDVKSGLLDRLRISGINSKEYTSSLIIGQLIISLIQIPIMFGTGLLFGFPATIQIAIAFVMAIIVSLAMSGLGLMLAGLVNTQEAAGSMSAMIATPMAFLASAFFIVPNPTIIEEGGIFGANAFGVMDLLPPSLAIEALRLILLGGNSLTDVLFYFVTMIVLSMIYLILGIYVYSKKHLNPK